jgi:REP element-mobilizing transposase RayT
MIYLITFACYGCHLHGDATGSVDRKHNLTGSRLAAPDPKRVAAELLQMDQTRYSMDESRRLAVLAALTERCSDRQWILLAAHVRTSHVHAIVEAEALPERVMNDLKSYASRRLNQLGFDGADRKRWARHGSTRWLSTREAVLAAIQYVIDKQGEPMAVYEA